MRLAAALGIVYVVWGSTYLAIAVADRTLPPMLMLSARFLLAGALLYGFLRRRGDVAAERPGRRQWGAAAAVGLALLVLDTGAVAWAEQRVASGTAALLIASVPLFMAIIDRAFFGMRLSVGAAAGIATGLLGVAILAGPTGRVDALGAAALLFASLAWAGGSAYARVAPLPRQPLLSAAMQMLCAGVGLAVVGIARGELGQLHPAAVSVESLAAFAFLVVFGSLVAFTAYAWLLGRAPTPLLSTYAYVNPAIAVLLGWAFAGEHVGGRELAAGLVILSSVGMLMAAHERREEAPPIPESLPGYIRSKDAQATELREVPRLAELHRIAA
ncbi:MAG TPA: EamA family transporter [Gaiellaceae bacterium]|nr:EamA family transporter [Gaiellaceae bacterium]